MVRDGRLEPFGHRIKRHVPGGFDPQNPRRQKTLVQTHCLAQYQAFGTKPPEIRGMRRVPLNRDAPGPVGGQPNPGSDPAIGAGGSDRLGHAALR